MQDEKLSDNEVVPMHWREESLDLFFDILGKYSEFLKPHDLPGNEDIKEELRKVSAYKNHICLSRKKCTGPLDRTELIMTAGEFGLIVDLLWREKSALNQKLREKRARTTIGGALQGLEEKIETIRGILTLEFIKTIPRKKAKVNSLYIQSTPPETVKGKNINYNQTFFGDVYGAAVNANYGDIEVELKQESQQAQKMLTDLLEEIKKMPVEDQQIKNDAISDIVTVQTQLKKKNPSKMIIDGALTSLSVLANSAQIASFFIAHIAPKLDDLMPLLQLLAK